MLLSHDKLLEVEILIDEVRPLGVENMCIPDDSPMLS